MLMVANIVSNIISGILAYGIAQIKSGNGYNGWRWIFILEGLLTIVVGLVCCWSNISSPEQATFLTEEEKEIIEEVVESRQPDLAKLAEWTAFLSNPLNYVWASLFVFTCATTYSISLFAPSFLQVFHPDWSVPQVQGQVVIIFVVSSVAALLAGLGADRLNNRLVFALVGYLFTVSQNKSSTSINSRSCANRHAFQIIGYGILHRAREVSFGVQLMALYFASLGTYTTMPMIWALSTVNQPTRYQQALGAGFVISIGNSGGFVSSWNFRTSEAPSLYAAGMRNMLIMTCVAAGLALSALGYISFVNRSRTSKADGPEKGVDRLTLRP